jgi:predicted PurR-regulated permease PerM
MLPLESNHQRAAWVILLLGLAVLLALLPYASGLIGGLVLYVIFAPVHAWVSRRLSPTLSAALVVALAFLALVIPALAFAGLLVDQAQDIAWSLTRGTLMQKISHLSIGRFSIGQRLASMGEQAISWLGGSALGLLGTATRIGLNLTIALFIVYYLLLNPGLSWVAVKPYLPFSDSNAEILRERFRSVTVSTVIGTGLTASIQGVFVALGFWATGLDNPLFWGLVTVVFAVLPVVGSGLIWGPGAVSLLLDGRTGPAVALAVLGVVLIGNLDILVRPLVYRRYAQIHPLITLVGAIGGVGYLGLLGILIGPLALSYFFELIRMYREEYLTGEYPAVKP